MRMLQVEAQLSGKSNLSFSRPLDLKKETGEKHDAFESRTWRQKMHVYQDGDNKGHVFIPAPALKIALQEIAKYLGETIPGQGKKTYTQKYKSGILCDEDLVLDCVDGDIKCEDLFVPSDGKSGSGSRVWKKFPYVTDWTTTARFKVLDPVLVDSYETIIKHLNYAGMFIGFGRFRPANGGMYGRFSVDGESSEVIEL